MASPAPAPAPSLAPAPHCAPFFINILLLNKDEVVAKNVQEKTGTGFFGKVASYAANKMVTDEKLLTNLSDTLMTTIRGSVEEMGIQMSVERKFQQGALVVMQFQVLDVDAIKVIRAGKGDDFANNFQTLVDAAKNLGLGDTIMEKIMEKIYGSMNESMIKKFSEMLPNKMKEKGVLVDCHACTMEEEALVFFELFGRIDA
jgi:hypothetical protein